MSFKVEVQADSTGEWCSNGLRFLTEKEAQAYGAVLFRNWTAVREWRVVETNDPVKYGQPVDVEEGGD